MPSEEYVKDVARVCSSLIREESVRALLQDAAPTEPGAQLTLELDVPSSSARELVAAIQLVQFVADVAVASVENLTDWAELDDPLLLEKLINDNWPLLDLSVIEISPGSWFIKFSLDPRRENGRKWLSAIMAIAAAAVGAVLTAGALVPIAVTTAVSAVAATPVVLDWTEDRSPPQFIDLSDLPPGTRIHIEIEIPSGQ